MTLLALDLGTHTGWALRRPSGAIESGTQVFAPMAFEGEGRRFLRFRSWLHDTKRLCDTRGEPLTIIRYERVNGARWRNAAAAAVCLGLRAHLEAWAEHHEIEYDGVSTGDLKRSATGKGNADKPAIIAAVRARGFSPADHNEADALALLLMDEPRARAA